MSSFTLQFGHDGYGNHMDLTDTETLALSVTGDDTTTWALEATLDGVNWVQVNDGDGAESRSTNALPQLFTVKLYQTGRIYVSNTALTYTINIKYFANS